MNKEFIEPFSGGTILSDEEIVLATILAESDITETYLRSIMNRIARDSIVIPVGESGFEERAKLRIKFKFYETLLKHVGDIRKKNKLKSSR